jgi:hypothetical protein
MGFQFFDFLSDLCEEVCNRLGGIAAEPMHEWIAGLRIQFDCGDAGTILPPVVLFFHEQVQLVKAVEYTAFLLHVVGEGFPEANECEAAFMLDGITHNPKIPANLIREAKPSCRLGGL